MILKGNKGFENVSTCQLVLSKTDFFPSSLRFCCYDKAKSHLGEDRVCLAYTSRSRSVTERSQGGN